MASATPAACYVYAVVPGGGGQQDLGCIGLDGARVYTVGGAGGPESVAAVVHACGAMPYASGDPGQVERWATAHDAVVAAALNLFDSVVPVGFDTIVHRPGQDAEEVARGWLREKMPSLTVQLARLRGRREYGVQLYWEPQGAELGAADTEAIREAQAEIVGKPPGLAYMYRQRVDLAVRRARAARADALVAELEHTVRAVAEAVRTERLKPPAAGWEMLANLSGLMPAAREPLLLAALAPFADMPAVGVRVTGPWPPYSFVEGV